MMDYNEWLVKNEQELSIECAETGADRELDHDFELFCEDRYETEKKNEKPTGHICKCGKFHQWPTYVFAHWTVRLNHTCKDCGEKVHLYKGKVT